MEYPGATLFLNVLNIWTWLIASKNLIINVMLCLAQGLANDYAPWSPLKTSVSILVTYTIFLWFSWHWSAVPRTTVASLILFSPRIWRDIIIVSFDIYSECIIIASLFCQNVCDSVLNPSPIADPWTDPVFRESSVLNMTYFLLAPKSQFVGSIHCRRKYFFLLNYSQNANNTNL